MLIRCEKCSTLYELDDKLLPLQGAPVQCSKCQFVFKAYPPAEQGPAPERPADGMDAGAEPAQDEVPRQPGPQQPTALDEPARAPTSDLVREGGALAAPASSRSGDPGILGRLPASAGGDAPRFTADGRPIRKVPFPTVESPAPGVRPMAARVPPPRTPRGIEPAALMRWIVVVVVLVAIALGAALAWRTYRGRQHASSARSPAGQSSSDAQGGNAGPQPRK